MVSETFLDSTSFPFPCFSFGGQMMIWQGSDIQVAIRGSLLDHVILSLDLANEFVVLNLLFLRSMFLAFFQIFLVLDSFGVIGCSCNFLVEFPLLFCFLLISLASILDFLL